ncbi:MAG: DUF4870 domain-containing protein [Terriglobales bacterium]
MAFCNSCGKDIGSANFCPACGANQTATPAAAYVAPSTEGLSENVAGLLCYLVGWITGIIFLLIDKRPWVRFQAAQSIVVFGGLFVIRVALGIMTLSIGGLIGFGLVTMLDMLIGLITLVLWILLMVKAYKHETFRVPIAAGIADGIAGK